jgi:FkbM family methyltransferase
VAWGFGHRRAANQAGEAALLRPRSFRLSDRGRNEARIRALCANAYMGEDTSLCRVLGRYKMYVDSRDTDISAHLILDGFWELWVVEILAERVRSGMVCVDVGAHLGFFSLLMADLVGPSGHVHAFEPNPALRRRLADSLAANGLSGRATLHGSPLLDQDDIPVRLQVPPRQPGHAHVERMPQGGAIDDWPGRSRRLDGIEGLAAPDLIKIDAEGSEAAIWQGMRGWFAEARPMTVLLEFAPSRYADPAAFLAQIVADGFTIAVADPEAGLQPSSAAAVAAMRADNLMLVLSR